MHKTGIRNVAPWVWLYLFELRLSLSMWDSDSLFILYFFAFTLRKDIKL